MKSIPRSLGTETGLLPVQGKASKMLTHTAALILKTSYQCPRNPWPPSLLASTTECKVLGAQHSLVLPLTLGSCWDLNSQLTSAETLEFC